MNNFLKDSVSYRKLCNSYQERLKKTIPNLKNFMENLQENLSEEEYKSMQSVVHGLAGTGTTFGFPRVSAAARELDALPSYKDAETSDLRGMFAQLVETCEDAIKQDRVRFNDGQDFVEANAQHNSLVLIVDDDEELSEFLQLQLKIRRIGVAAVENGGKALDFLKHKIPDIIILDIMMPGLSGHEVLNHLKKDSILKRIPVLMLTSRQEQKDIAGAFDTGAIDYIVKPFKPDHLIVKIEEILDAARKTIMVVENDDLLLELLTHTYENRGFRVVHASSGREAWTKITKSAPDLIVLDWMLSGIEATALLKNIRNDSSTKNIPIIVLAAKDDEGIAKEQNIKNYLTKPFVPRDLLKRSIALLA